MWSQARRRASWGAALLAALVAVEAGAFVPAAEKIAREVARANRADGRTDGLLLTVALRDADGRTLAQGELASDPRGLARLELAGGGIAERHLLRSGEHLAARDGVRVPDPAPWLPPFFLLQASHADRLLSAVASGEDTVLGRHEGDVAWVLGGRDLPPPANPSAAEVGSTGPRASVWVRRDDFRIVRIDRSDGTRFVLGPARELGGATLPEWIRIERPGQPSARLDVLAARRADFDLATTFGTEWLFAR